MPEAFAAILLVSLVIATLNQTRLGESITGGLGAAIWLTGFLIVAVVISALFALAAATVLTSSR